MLGVDLRESPISGSSFIGELELPVEARSLPRTTRANGQGTPGQGAQGGTLRPPPAVLRVTKGWRKLGRGTVNSGVHTLSLLPKKQSPWFNPIEPKWVHGKRKVVEPDGLPTAYELAGRECVLPSIVCEAVGGLQVDALPPP
jgi:hypothetical protein